MTERLPAPEEFTITEKDGAVLANWKAVFGADGYKLFFYSPYEPTKCIKSRYSQKTKRMVTGLENGKQYLVEVRAFYLKNDIEIFGEPTRKIAFSPICGSLKAEGTVCLKKGEVFQLHTESPDPDANISYTSENTEIAEVNSSGVVTAVNKGSTEIKISSGNGSSYRVRVFVDRSLNIGKQHAVMMFTGDIMCTLSMQKQSCGRDFSRSFENIKSTLAKADLVAGVLDQVCYDGAPYDSEQQRLSGTPIKSNAPSEFIFSAANAGFDGLFTTTDNILSEGEAGLDYTVAAIKRAGMYNFGTCGNNPTVVDVKGFKVGIISTDLLNDNSDSASFLNKTGKYDCDYFVELLNTARAMGAEFIVAYQHWGTANSHQIRKNQRAEAEFMARSGADLIIGSHTHTVQKFEFIDGGNGRKVPCAFSLGTFLTNISELRENRDGIILRVELYCEGDEISAKCSYIPVYSEIREFGAASEPAFPAHSENTDDSYKRTRKFIGTELRTFSDKPSGLIIGSSILYRILSSGKNFRIDRTGMYLSPLSLGAEIMHKANENMDTALALDVSKDISGYIKNNAFDFVAVDFFTAATVSLFRHTNNGDCFYSNTGKLRCSEFYEKHRDQWIRIRAPFGETLWKPLLKNFAEKLSSAVPSEKIILFRCNISSWRKKGLMLRTTPENERRNRLMREMEDYFISLVDPAVVALSDKYFVEDDTEITFEAEYYSDAYKAAVDIVSGKGRTYVDSPDAQTWFDRVMRYYESMTLRSYHKRLLDMSNAADKIVAYTSVDFCARNSERIIRLKRAGKSDLISVKGFFENDKGAEEIVQAAEIINLVEKGNLTKPYDFYKPAFDGHYNIVKKIAYQLSKELGASVEERSAELVFLLRGKPQLRRYMSEHCNHTVDIWGSSVSRESVNLCREAFVGSFVQMQPAIFALEKPIEYEIPDDIGLFCKSRYRRKVLEDAFKRKGIETLEDSAAQWIVVDFYNLICTMAEFHGEVFVLDDFLHRTEFYKNIKKDITECCLFEKRDMKFCFEGITKFSNEILDIYGENIILIKTEPKNRYINHDFRLCELPDIMHDIKKKFISLCEERFAGITGCYVIDISKNFYSSDDYPLGGRDITHYEAEFYRQTAEFISRIFKGTDRKVFNDVDQNYILLRDLKLKR